MLRVFKPGGRAAFLTWGRFEQLFFESNLDTAPRSGNKHPGIGSRDV